MKLESHFKTIKDVRVMSFGKKQPQNFNYVDFNDANDTYLSNSCLLAKQMNDSFVLRITTQEGYDFPIKQLKLTNQGITSWEDYWIDTDTKNITDPRIEEINLQKNNIINANFNLKRSELKRINLEGNLNLQSLFVYDAPKLEVINISNCTYLDIVNLGMNKNIVAFLARGCNLTSFAQERLLSSLIPTKTTSSNSPVSLFRREYKTILDMRGSEIDWSNRKIASKIRMLLCNNWMVLWDNPPPISIVPPQMYAFFTTSLEDKLIKDYYG